MVQLGQDAGFGKERRGISRKGHPVAVRHLDGDLAPEYLVPPEVHHTAPTPADRGQDRTAVDLESFSRGWRFRSEVPRLVRGGRGAEPSRVETEREQRFQILPESRKAVQILLRSGFFSELVPQQELVQNEV